MEVLPWYNENQFRDYPLQENTLLSREFVVDAGFTLRVTASVQNEVAPEIILRKIVKTASVLEYHVATPASYIASAPFDTTDYTVLPLFKADAAICSSPLAFAGTIVVASVAKLANQLPLGDTLLEIPFDKHVCDIINGQVVSGLRIGNVHKRQSLNFGACGIPRPAIFTNDAFVWDKQNQNRVGVVYQAACPISELRIVPGLNAAITPNNVMRQITFSVNKSQTIPQCEEIPISPQEQAAIANGDVTLSPQRCSAVVTSINGLPGPNVSIIGGPGVTIKKKNEKTLQIILNDGKTGVCPGS